MLVIHPYEQKFVEFQMVGGCRCNWSFWWNDEHKGWINVPDKNWADNWNPGGWWEEQP